MARAIWTGSLSFGLVNVPVQLFSGVHDMDLHFTQLHEKDGAPIEVRRFCSEEDKEVPYEAIGHGFELDGGKQVVITDAELATVQPRKTRTIDIEAFVDLEEVDPILFDHPYVLAPAGEGEGVLRAYRLLLEVMSQTDRAALGRVVIRTKEYLVLIRAREDRLALTTLRFHDEVRPVKDVDGGGKKPTAKQLSEMVKVIEALSCDWDPSNYKDQYRKRLEKVIADKKKGKKITVPEAEKEPGPVPDLMEALQATLEEMKSGRSSGGRFSSAEESSKESSSKSSSSKGSSSKSSSSKGSSSKSSSSKSSSSKSSSSKSSSSKSSSASKSSSSKRSSSGKRSGAKAKSKSKS